MKLVGIALFILATIGAPAAQGPASPNSPPGIQVLSSKWKPDRRLKGPARQSESKDADPSLPLAYVTYQYGFSYEAKVKNTGAKVIKSVTWVYIFADSLEGGILARHGFKTKAKIEPGAEKTLEAFTISPPSKVVSAKSVQENPDKPFAERAVILRVEYADGSSWQRPGINFQ